MSPEDIHLNKLLSTPVGAYRGGVHREAKSTREEAVSRREGWFEESHKGKNA
jgi:hypothetical protein